MRENDATIRAQMCRKFNNECGASINEFGGVVIDEISFIDTPIFGHVDRALSILLESTDSNTLCGGIPLLLAGDNHQKPPPGGIPWYQYMVKVAAKEEDDPFVLGVSSSKQCGLRVLRAAKRVNLTRLMRAKDDPAFIGFQLRMRQTELLHPIPDAFIDSLGPVSRKDLQEDAAWHFAPIGVLSHVERDYINYRQLHAFAKAFGLPVIRWKRELVDGAAMDQRIKEDIYAHEPNLWSYFVEGAPTLLVMDTISSVRMLVNGSPGLLDSLTITDGDDLTSLRMAYEVGYNENMTSLLFPPLAVNIVCGGTDDLPMLWHEVINVTNTSTQTVTHLLCIHPHAPLGSFTKPIGVNPTNGQRPARYQ